MLNRQSARSLARYRLWADQLTYETVASLPPGEAVRPVTTTGEELRQQVDHFTRHFILNLAAEMLRNRCE